MVLCVYVYTTYINIITAKSTDIKKKLIAKEIKKYIDYIYIYTSI